MQLHCPQARETEKLESKPNKRRLCWVLSASGVHGFRQMYVQQPICIAHLHRLMERGLGCVCLGKCTRAFWLLCLLLLVSGPELVYSLLSALSTLATRAAVRGPVAPMPHGSPLEMQTLCVEVP